jgi:hypothetical protein
VSLASPLCRSTNLTLLVPSRLAECAIALFVCLPKSEDKSIHILRRLYDNFFTRTTASGRAEPNLADKERRIVDRSEITDIFCGAISSGNVPALLEEFVSEETTWALVSGTGPSDSERYFRGIPGLRGLVEFCRDSLKIGAGEMTGCVMKGDCLFAFGKIRVGSAIEESSPETSFAVNLVWRGLQIVSAQLRIMWPLPPQ